MTVNEVFKFVSKRTELTKDEICGYNTSQKFTHTRNMVACFLHKEMGINHTEIGKILGGRSRKFSCEQNKIFFDKCIDRRVLAIYNELKNKINGK